MMEFITSWWARNYYGEGRGKPSFNGLLPTDLSFPGG